MSRTRHKCTRNNHWHSKPHGYPRHKMNSYEGTKASMRLRLDESRWDLNCCDHCRWYNGYSWIDGYVTKHLGEKWDDIHSHIVRKLKEEKVSTDRIDGIVRYHILGWKRFYRYVKDPKYIVNDEGLLIENPEYAGYKRRKTKQLATSYIRYNKSQLRNIKPVILRSDAGWIGPGVACVCKGYINYKGYVLKLHLYNNVSDGCWRGFSPVSGPMLGLRWWSDLLTISRPVEVHKPIISYRQGQEVFHYLNGVPATRREVYESSYGRLHLYYNVKEAEEKLKERIEEIERTRADTGA